MRSKALFALPVVLLFAACSGGGSTGTGTIPAPGVTPTPVPQASPSPSPAPSSGPIADSTAAAYTLSDDPNKALGDPGTINNPFPNTGRSSNAPVDGIACGSMSPVQHFHAHISVFDNGKQVVVPAGIGIFQPMVKFPAYYEDAGPGGCDYDVHVHSDEAVIHIESPSATQTFNLKEFFDIWGQPLTANGFGPFVGPTRVFATDESTGSAGSYTVTEVTGQDLTTVQLKRHVEYTVEVGPTFVPIPNYIWSGGL